VDRPVKEKLACGMKVKAASSAMNLALRGIEATASRFFA